MCNTLQIRSLMAKGGLLLALLAALGCGAGASSTGGTREGLTENPPVTFDVDWGDVWSHLFGAFQRTCGYSEVDRESMDFEAFMEFFLASETRQSSCTETCQNFRDVSVSFGQPGRGDEAMRTHMQQYPEVFPEPLIVLVSDLCSL